MTQLTEERFEKLLDTRLSATEQLLIKRIDVSQSELARMTKRGFDDVLERLDVREQVISFERKFRKLEETLHIKL